MKVFLFDADVCNGCRNCQLACKDEHCDNEWLPYAAKQPQTGQFWCDIDETVRGQVPKVQVSYIVKMGAQDEALRQFAPEALMDRDDGLVVLEPAKCEGRKDIAEMFEGVFWNEELNICQGCTGCAHLIDDGWDVPRCVEACGMGALRFGDEEDFGEELERATRTSDTSHVYYLNYPKRFLAGEVVDTEADEVVIDATVTIENKETGALLKTKTDELGDFWFKQIDAADYNVYFEKSGYLTRMEEASTKDQDVNIGTIALYTAEI